MGSCAGIFYAFDRATGEIRWRHDIRPDGNSSFHGDPVVAGDLVVFDADLPSTVGHVYAAELDTGRLRWKYRSVGVPTDLARLGTRVYAVNADHTLLSLDLQGGKLDWEFSSPDPSSEKTSPVDPAVTSDRVIFATPPGTVYALDSQSGGVIWKRELGARVSTSVLVVDDAAYVGTAQGRLYRLDVATGAVAAQREIPGVPGGKPAFADDSILLVSYPGRLLAVDRALTTVRWQQTSSNWQRRPLVRHGSVLVGNPSGEVFAFALSTGIEQWSHRFEGIITSIGSSHDLLYVGTQEGVVYAFRPPPAAAGQ